MTTELKAIFIAAAAALAAAGCSGEKKGAHASATGAEETPSNDSRDMPDDVKKQVEDIAGAFIPDAKQFGVKNFKIIYEMDGQQTGTRILWVEDYGARVGLEEETTTFNIKEHKLTYWDGEKAHVQTNDGAVSSIGIRPIVTEPSSFATTNASALEGVGYERLGDKTILGVTCEEWKNETLNYIGCRWKHIDLEFRNGLPKVDFAEREGTKDYLQNVTAVEFSEGEKIPAHIKALAK